MAGISNNEIKRVKALQQKKVRDAEGLFIVEGEKMVQEAIANGIVKVNLATEIKDNFMRALKGVLTSSDEIDLRKVFPKAIDPVVDLLCEKYRMVGSAKNA